MAGRGAALSTRPTLSRGLRLTPRRFGTSMATATSAQIPNGTFKRKIQRHDAYVVMKPPTGGPTTGAAIAGQVMGEIACMSRLFSVLRTTISRPTGTIIAPPAPCSKRAAVNSVTEFDKPHNTEAITNTTIALKHTQ